MTSKDTLNDISTTITLNLLQTATTPINYQILQSLPTNVPHLMTALNLTKVPVNNHLNELAKYNLLKREKGTGKVYPTEMTATFLTTFDQFKLHIQDNLSEIVHKLIQ